MCDIASSLTLNEVANNEASGSSQTGQDIDEGLYSRQLYVLGHHGMRRMAASDVLISGLGGLGVEIAKNVILAGVKSVTLHDESACSIADLSSQFYLSEDDIGKNRAEASLKQLSELNMYVAIRSHTGTLTDEFIKRFRVVVLTNSSLSEQLRINEITHSNDIALIIADVRGLFAQVFCDFGPAFTNDTNDVEPVSIMVESITKDTDGNGVVTCFEDYPLQDGDYVTFSEIQGMTELNGCEPRKVERLERRSFSIGDISNLSKYELGGIAQKVKIQEVLNFKSLQESIRAPEYIDYCTKSDHTKFDQLHLAFSTLHKYIEEHGSVPKPWCEEDAIEFVSLAKSLSIDGGNAIENTDLLEKFAYISAGNVNPMSAAIGGIVAHEVVKACSGRLYPVFQWLYFDALECLPDNRITQEEASPIGSRYDGQIAVFGSNFQDKLGGLKYFVVGAGAIGCELLKNFAMVGLGVKTGLITVTDMDFIEKSNLNRQFLFRPHDVQCPKASTAAKAIKQMNPNVNIVAHENCVGPDTEAIYDDAFFESLDGVANALDSDDARIYMEKRCVYYRKPLLESGTSGARGHTGIVVPFLTGSWNGLQIPQEKSYPLKTLKYFPNAIEHTLHWARDNFDGLFKASVEIASQYLSDSDFIERTLQLSGMQPIEILKSVKLALVDDRPKDMQDCVSWARNHWEEQYANQIKQFLLNFPPDKLTATGQPFWSGPKRCPEALTFNVDDPLHFDYIYTGANLKAEVYGIPQVRDKEVIKELIANVVVPHFHPKLGIKVMVKDSQMAVSNATNVDMDPVTQLQEELPSPEELNNLRLYPIKFEKDDDTNLHMDYIVAASNLRAVNYKIPPADRHRSKLIVGKIIPAIVTSTSFVAGMVCLELYKLANGMKKLQDFRASHVNLDVPRTLVYRDLAPAPKKEYCGISWTLWDRFEIQGEMTLSEFLDYFKTSHGLDVEMISQGVCAFYSLFMEESIIQERLNLPMSEIVETVTKRRIEPHVKALVFELCCNDADGNSVETPYVKYTLPLY